MARKQWRSMATKKQQQRINVYGSEENNG